MVDFTQLTDEELNAIANKDYSSLSTESLYKLAGKPVEFDASIAAQNILPSAGRMLSNVYHAATHPLDTIEGMDAAIMAFGAKGMGALGFPVTPEDTAAADNLINTIKNQYGSADKMKLTAMEDPVQMASDVAGLLSGVGTLPKMGAAATLGRAIDPMRYVATGGRLARKGMVEMLPKDLVEDMYKSISGIADPDVVETLIRNRLNPARIEDMERLQAMRNQEGNALREIVEANNSTIPASELFKGMRDRSDIMDEINVSGGTQGTAMQRQVQRMAEHLGYRPAMSDPDFPMIWGNKPLPASTIPSSMVGPNGQPMQMPNPEWTALQTAIDTQHPLLNIWELKKGGWDSITNNRDSHLRHAPPGATAGTLAAKQEATFNADRIINDALSGTDYAAQNAATADVIRAHTAAERVHPRLVKRNNPFGAIGSVPVSASGAAGYAIGGPGLGAAAAGTALGISMLNVPKRTLDLTNTIRGYQNQSLGEILRQAPSADKNALFDIVSRLDEEQKKKAKR